MARGGLTIIFLGCNGVLNNVATPGTGLAKIEPSCVDQLNYATDHFDRDSFFVISCPWRFEDYPVLKIALHRAGLKCKVFDVTGKVIDSNKTRGDEIQAYLTHYVEKRCCGRRPITKYIIVDAIGDMAPLTEDLLLVDPLFGFTRSNADELIRRLA